MNIVNNPAMRDSNNTHEVSTGLARRNQAIQDEDQREGGEFLKKIDATFGRNKQKTMNNMQYESSHCNI